MRHLKTVFALSAAVLLFGCAAAPKPAQTTPTTITRAPVTPNIAGNWQFSATSTVPGASPVSIAGYISQEDTVVGGVLHVFGSKCVDQMTNMSMTGTVNIVTAVDTASATASGVDGQTVTFTGTFSGDVPSSTFTGTYSIKGGCSAGDQGTLTGRAINYIPNTLSGTFTNSAQKTFHVSGDIWQTGAFLSEGSSAIGANEPSVFDTPCFNAGTIKQGIFPSPSYILGTSVAVEFDTSNGILTVLGTWNPDTLQITGNYTISGGTCEDTGTAVLILSSPWDY